MNISDTGIALIKQWEGCELVAYKDVAGVLTIGYGHTGSDVHEGLVINEARAEQLLRLDLERFEGGVNGLLGDAAVSQNQFDALVSLAYNIGLGNFSRSTVLRKVKEGDFEGAGRAFLMWRKARDPETGRLRVVQGLLNRRRAERSLFDDGSRIS